MFVCLFETYQYPIVQGISLDKAVIDLESDIFDHGQAYVALGRFRRLEGVLLIGLLRAVFDKNKSCVHGEYIYLHARLAGCPVY